MAKLDKFLGGCSGYFRENCETEFPWDCTDRGVWYSLFVVEDGRIETYGFTAAKGSKEKMRLLLKEIDSSDDAMLIGVWNGRWKTHLFILDIPKSIKKLEALQ